MSEKIYEDAVIKKMEKDLLKLKNVNGELYNIIYSEINNKSGCYGSYFIHGKDNTNYQIENYNYKVQCIFQIRNCDINKVDEFKFMYRNDTSDYFRLIEQAHYIFYVIFYKRYLKCV